MNYSFEDLELNDELLRGIYSYGFEKPSKIQYKSIPLIKSGKDLIAHWYPDINPLTIRFNINQ